MLQAGHQLCLAACRGEPSLQQPLRPSVRLSAVSDMYSIFQPTLLSTSFRMALDLEYGLLDGSRDTAARSSSNLQRRTHTAMISETTPLQHKAQWEMGGRTYPSDVNERPGLDPPALLDRPPVWEILLHSVEVLHTLQLPFVWLYDCWLHIPA